MAYPANPTKKRKPGEILQAPDLATVIVRPPGMTPGAPVGGQVAQQQQAATKLVPPTPLGTQAGSAVRAGIDSLAAAAPAVINAQARAGAAGMNTLTAPFRAAGGVVRDFTRGVAGLPQSADAGQPSAGVSPMQLSLPGATPAAAQARFAAGGQRTGPAAGSAYAAKPPAAQIGAAAALSGPAAPAALDKDHNPLADNISQANLAAANRLKAPARQPAGVDSGTDVVGADGKSRHLNYGATVNGVPTFSDGSHGIARTMSDDNIQQAGDRLSRADKGALGNALASDTLGHTASQEEMVGQNLAQLQRNQPITGSRPSAAMFAAAERNSIAMQDPRSAAGIAARNLSMDAGYARTPRLRRMAEQQLAGLSQGAGQAGLLGIQNENAQQQTAQQGANQLAETNAQGQNQLANTALSGQNQLANTKLQVSSKLLNPQAGKQVQLADGSIGIQNPVTGGITLSKLPDGTTAKGQPKNAPPPIYTSAGGQAALQSLTNNILGINPMTGMIDGKDGGASRLPSNAEQFSAMKQAQQQLQQLGGGQQSAASKPAAPAVGTVQDNHRFKGGDPANPKNWEKL